MGGFESEVLVMVEVQSHSFAPALPELGVWIWDMSILRFSGSGLSLQRIEMVPCGDLLSSSDVSGVGGFILVLQLTCFSALEVLLLLFILKKLLL